MNTLSTSPKWISFRNLIDEIHQFHGQEIYKDLGPSIASKKPIFHFIFKVVNIASRYRLTNALMITLVMLLYREIREPDDGKQIFQYGTSETNIAAFKRLNQGLDAKLVDKIAVNGRQIPWTGRIKAVSAFGSLWRAAGILTKQRHPRPLVQIQSILSGATALLYAACPLALSVRMICVGNDHSPVSVALLSMAKFQGKTTCYLQHAPVTDYFPPLTHDLSILFDQASENAYRIAAQKRNVAFDENSIALLSPYSERFRYPNAEKPPYRIGICLSFLPNLSAVEALIKSLSGRDDVSSICIRSHPRCQLDKSAIAVLEKTELRPQDESAMNYFSEVDIVLVPSSGVAIDALHYGLPTFFAAGTDTLPDDYYGFVADGILPKFSKDTLEAPNEFFDTAWEQHFAEHDETVNHSPQALQIQACQSFMRIFQKNCEAENSPK